jgi:hypothetical protein
LELSWLIGEDGADGLALCILYPDENAVVFLGGQDVCFVFVMLCFDGVYNIHQF